MPYLVPQISKDQPAGAANGHASGSKVSVSALPHESSTRSMSAAYMALSILSLPLMPRLVRRTAGHCSAGPTSPLPNHSAVRHTPKPGHSSCHVLQGVGEDQDAPSAPQNKAAEAGRDEINMQAVRTVPCLTPLFQAFTCGGCGSQACLRSAGVLRHPMLCLYVQTMHCSVAHCSS